MLQLMDSELEDVKRRASLGVIGEDIASDFLTDRGYRIIERNFKSGRWGELDIITEKDNTLIFVEVRARTKGSYVSPEESITHHKIKTLERASKYYKIKNPDVLEGMRLDLISIILHPETKEPLKIKHFKNING